MNRFTSMSPTPESLRNGRRTFVAVAAIFGVIFGLIVLVPGFADTTMLTVMAASLLTLGGTGIQYLGQPSLVRYRIGMVLTAVGIVASIWMLVANPFVQPAA